MALIAMATYDTEENGRSWMTRTTLASLDQTVDFREHRVHITDNGSCLKTVEALEDWEADHRSRGDQVEITYLSKNVGTAKAINLAWLSRWPGEVAIKMDNDVVIHSDGWADQLVEVFQYAPKCGIVGLKRKDCREFPGSTEPGMDSELMYLPHQLGEPWIIIEVVQHVMGTCQAYNPLLLDVIGFLEQMDGLYGYDDALAAVRCLKAGFYSAFLPHIRIDHIDPGGDAYTEWKSKYAWDNMEKFNKRRMEYLTGKRPLRADSGWDASKGYAELST